MNLKFFRASIPDVMTIPDISKFDNVIYLSTCNTDIGTENFSSDVMAIVIAMQFFNTIPYDNLLKHVNNVDINIFFKI